MVQITNVGQALPGNGIAASAIFLMVLIFGLFGIKIWGFKRRLHFEQRNNSTEAATTITTTHVQAARTPSQLTRTGRGLQVNGTENSVHGVFRQRNVDEFESAQPSTSSATFVPSRSVPDLRDVNKKGSVDLSDTVELRKESQSSRRRRHEVHTTSFEYYPAPPTRKAPTPTVPSSEAMPTQLGMPNFDHFAEKYELITAKGPSQHRLNKDSGGYVKYEPVDDDLVDFGLGLAQASEPLTPDVNDPCGASLSVSAVIHNEFNSHPEPVEQWEALASETPINIEANDTSSAFVVEMITESDPVEEVPKEPPQDLFADLETIGDSSSDAIEGNEENIAFRQIRSTYVMHEADILDIQSPNIDADTAQQTVPNSPPGFGKSIDEDWENFENLDIIVMPEPNWTLHPDIAQTALADMPPVENFFEQLEVVEPAEPSRSAHAMADDQPPILPDYETLMLLEGRQLPDNLPKYADVVENIEELYAELGNNGIQCFDNTANDFEALCQSLEVNSPAPQVPARPKAAPRLTRMTPSASEVLFSSDESFDDSQLSNPTGLALQPQPAKRKTQALKVRFDMENLQYFQSTELDSSSGSDSVDNAMAPIPRARTGAKGSGAKNSLDNSDDNDDTSFGWIALHRQQLYSTEELQQPTPSTETDEQNDEAFTKREQRRSRGDAED